MMTERKRRFAAAYMQLANATQAAKQAGYSEKSAHACGHRLVRDADVQAIISANCTKRDVRAEQTYQDLIKVSQVAIDELVHAKAGSDTDRIARAIENARKCLETVGKAEGLFITKHEHSGPKGVPLPSAETHVTIKLDLSKLADDELELYRRVVERRAQVSPGDGSGHPAGGSAPASG